MTTAPSARKCGSRRSSASRGRGRRHRGSAPPRRARWSIEDALGQQGGQDVLDLDVAARQLVEVHPGDRERLCPWRARSPYRRAGRAVARAGRAPEERVAGPVHGQERRLTKQESHTYREVALRGPADASRRRGRRGGTRPRRAGTSAAARTESSATTSAWGRMREQAERHARSLRRSARAVTQGAWPRRQTDRAARPTLVWTSPPGRVTRQGPSIGGPFLLPPCVSDPTAAGTLPDVTAIVALDRLDSEAGRLMEGLVVAHHRRRLTRLGQGPCLDAPAGGWAAGGAAAAAGERCRRSSSTAPRCSPRVAEAIESAASVGLARRLVLHAGLAAPRDDEAADAARAARARRAARRRPRAGLGRRAAAALPPRPERRPRRARRARRGARGCGSRSTRGSGRCTATTRSSWSSTARSRSSAASTSPRYAGDRLDSSEHPAARLDRLARRRGARSAARRSPTSPTTSASAGRRSRASGCRAAAAAGARGRRRASGRPHRAGAHLRAAAARRVRDPRVLPARRSARAQRLIYLENQFLWSPEIVAVLVDKLRRPPDDRFRLVVLLPAKPNNGNDDTRGQLGAPRRGRRRRRPLPRLHALPVRRRARRPVYVHAKIGIVDDAWLTLGSANLNEHSLFNDTEMNLVTHDAALAKATPAPALERAPRRGPRRARPRSRRGRRRALAPARRGAARAPREPARR